MSRVSHQHLSFIEVSVKEQLINSLLKYSVKNVNYMRVILYKCAFQRNTSVHVCSLPTHFSMSSRSGRKAWSQAKHPELLIVCSTKQNSVVTETCEMATKYTMRHFLISLTRRVKKKKCHGESGRYIFRENRLRLESLFEFFPHWKVRRLRLTVTSTHLSFLNIINIRIFKILLHFP